MFAFLYHSTETSFQPIWSFLCFVLFLTLLRLLASCWCCLCHSNGSTTSWSVDVLSPLESHNNTCHLLAGQQTPELSDLRAGSGRFCSADSEPQGHFAGSSAQPCHRSGRLLWRDAVRLVQDEIPSCSCRVSHYCILGIWTWGKLKAEMRKLSHFPGAAIFTQKDCSELMLQ